MGSNLELNLKAYNATSAFSGTDQFLSMTKLKLQTIQQKVTNDRLREHKLKLDNIALRSQISELKKQTDSLRGDIQTQEHKARNASKKQSAK